MPVAAVAAVGLSVAGGIASAAGAKSAQAKAQRQNDLRAKQDQDREYRYWRESRGSEGFSLFPLYANEGGEAFEPQAFADALRQYQFFTQQTPAQLNQHYEGITKPLLEQQQQINRGIDTGVFRGGLLEEEKAALAPIEKARTDLASARRSTFLDAANAQIARMNAMNVRRGYGSDSYSKNLLQMEAQRRGAEGYATEFGNANIANATDRARLVAGDIGRRLAYKDFPQDKLRQELYFDQAPLALINDRFDMAMNPINQFRIGPSRPNLIRQPEYQPRINSAMIAGGALSSVGSAIGGLGAAGAFGGFGGGASQLPSQFTPSNFGSLSSAQQNQYFNTWNNNQHINSALYQ